MTEERPETEPQADDWASLIVSPTAAGTAPPERKASAGQPREITETPPARPAGAPETKAPRVAQLVPVRSRPAWLVPAAVALAVLLAVVVAGAGVAASWVRAASATQRARTDALAAARSHAQAILSYDHRTLDADFARAQQVITGPFKAEYERTTTAVVRPTATEYKAVVKAEVTSAGVVHATSDRVVVLLFVDQTTTSTRLTKAKRDASRVRMTLVKAGGRWLVSNVDAL